MRAVAAWNASGAKVRFVAVPAAQAELVISDSEACPPATGGGVTRLGEATIGYGPAAHVHIYRSDGSSQLCNPYTTANTVAHELGHVLGLDHETRVCTTMNPVGGWRGPQLCRVPFWQWHCRLLEADDVAGAVALYGGAPRPLPAAGCDLYPQPAAPRLTLIAYAARGSLEVSFRRPAATAALPAFLLDQRGPESYATAFTPGRACTADPARQPHYRWRAAAGAVQSGNVHYDRLGISCLQLWAFDGLGRPSPATSRLVRLTD